MTIVKPKTDSDIKHYTLGRTGHLSYYFNMDSLPFVYFSQLIKRNGLYWYGFPVTFSFF